MLSELFKPYKASITRYGSDSATIASFRIKCIDANIDTSFSWQVDERSLEYYLKPYVHGLMAVLSNGSVFDKYQVYNPQKLFDFINENYVKLTPDDKLNSILEYMESSASYDGQTIAVKSPSEIKVAKMYFYNIQEWRFYLQSAVEQGFMEIKQIPGSMAEPKPQNGYRLTVKGLSRLIKIHEGKDSVTCFVAMAFTDDMFAILDSSIKPALGLCGFKSYVVSETHVDSDKTINDAILAGIKKSRFTIADFTYHRGGVYFEAGYALGRGQKVIYSCREDEIGKAHFDIRNYQHVVWKDSEDFKQKLIDKIEAFIKD